MSNGKIDRHEPSSCRRTKDGKYECLGEPCLHAAKTMVDEDCIYRVGSECNSKCAINESDTLLSIAIAAFECRRSRV
jgi:hypothetical protein